VEGVRGKVGMGVEVDVGLVVNILRMKVRFCRLLDIRIWLEIIMGKKIIREGDFKVRHFPSTRLATKLKPPIRNNLLSIRIPPPVSQNPNHVHIWYSLLHHSRHSYMLSRHHKEECSAEATPVKVGEEDIRVFIYRDGNHFVISSIS